MPRGDRGPRGPDRTGSSAWRELAQRIEACRACRLGSIRSHAVVYRGGPAPAFLFVGEAPGAEEDRLGRPFVGRGGQRLDAALAGLGVRPAEVGFVNLIKCRPPENRFDPGAARACRPFLLEQLALLRPRVLIPLGARALAALDPDAPPISQAAGRPRTTAGARLFPMLHPAAPLHDPRRRPQWERDVAALGRYLAELRREAL